MNTYVNISELKNKILTNVIVNKDDNIIVFQTKDDEAYKMSHIQNCCESVYIDDICGNINDLIGLPLYLAEEISTLDSEDKEIIAFEILNALKETNNTAGSYTWTFYKLGTTRGTVTIRWYGSSNGFYSERVDIIKI